jgi:3',5'-cyclic AMP phosphodiesterase CpdA
MRQAPIISVFLASVCICFYSIPSIAQTPDILTTQINSTKPGYQWSFSFVQLTDIHIGEGTEEFGTNGYMDTLTGSETGESIDRLNYAVQWINQNYIQQKISFVIITGDLTESGERSEFYKAKEILDQLIIPYIPIPGNHDIWPHSDAGDSPRADGDSLINHLFVDRFAALSTEFPGWNNGTRLTPAPYSVANGRSYFFNFYFPLGSYYFLCADFNSRQHKPVFFNGSNVDGQMHNIPGGTWPYFQHVLTNEIPQEDENIIIFSHHPMASESWNFANAFSYAEYDTISTFIQPFTSSLSTWFAGHIHRDENYNIATWAGSPNIVSGYETESNKELEYGHFRLVKVYDSIQVFHNNPGQAILFSPRVYFDEGADIARIFIPVTNLNVKASVYNTTGKMIACKEYQSGNELILELPGIKAGLYYLMITLPDEQYSVPFAVTR